MVDNWFALYSVHPSTSSAADKSEEECCEADFRLDLLNHSVQSEDLEVELSLFITRRLAKGLAYDGNGSVTVFDAKLSTMCYYCWLRVEETMATTESSQKIRFCSELNAYCERLRCLLLTISDATVSDEIKELLSSWYDRNVLYVSRCVSRLKDGLTSVIYAALMGMPVDISGGSRLDEEDITNVPALTQDKAHNDVVSPTTSLLVDLSTGHECEATHSVKRLTVTVSESSLEVSSDETNRFCQEWATTMQGEEEESKPSYLRQVVENFKLKIIQDLNNLRRLLQHAEKDHYALYRSFTFLRECGNISPLLRLCRQESQSTSDDVHAVLDILHEHMQTEDVI